MINGSLVSQRTTRTGLPNDDSDGDEDGKKSGNQGQNGHQDLVNDEDGSSARLFPRFFDHVSWRKHLGKKALGASADYLFVRLQRRRGARR
jgi:hypothetical protein